MWFKNISTKEIFLNLDSAGLIYVDCDSGSTIFVV